MKEFWKMTAQILYVVLSICCLYYADFLHKNIKPSESPPANIEKKDFIPSWEYYWAAYDKNNNKTYYYYNGLWYDKPTQIRQYPNQDQKVLGTANWTQSTYLR